MSQPLTNEDEMTLQAVVTVQLSEPKKQPAPEERRREVVDPLEKREPKRTPMPLRQMIPMTFVLLNESLCSTVLLPYVGSFVAHLCNVEVNEAGYLSGTLVGVFMLGQVISAKLWGWLSDQYGRRFPLISGMLMSGLMMLFFGLSSNVWMCAFFRFLHGLFNGNILVAKTMMADITDKTNEAIGFAFVSFSYGIGILIGPALGGLLYDPARPSGLSWPQFSETGIFARHPAFLPSLVLFVYSNIGVAACTLFVKETNLRAKPLPFVLRLLFPCFLREVEFYAPPATVDAIVEGLTDDKDAEVIAIVDGALAAEPESSESPVLFEPPCIGEGDGEGSAALFFSSQQNTSTDKTEARGAALAPASLHEPIAVSLAAGEGRTHASPSDESHAKAPRQSSDETDEAVDVTATVPPEGCGVVRRFGYRQAFELPITRTMLFLYMLLSAADMAVQEIFPLWAIVPKANGGLGYSPDTLGYILLANGVPCISANLLFPIVCGRYRNKVAIMRLGVFFGGCAIVMMPLSTYFNLGRFSLIIYVLICSSTRQFFVSWCYGLTTMLTARSAPHGHVGSIMGINQSCGAVVRAIVPFVVAPLFAFTVSGHQSFPFNHVFVFFLSACLFFSAGAYSTTIRTNADSRLEMVESRQAHSHHSWPRSHVFLSWYAPRSSRHRVLFRR